MNYFIHASAEVSEDTQIGIGTKIWNLAQIREHCIIGEDCIISKNVYIDTQVILGNRVKVQNNVNIYHGVVVEDDVFLGPSTTFTNDLFPRAFNKQWKITKTLVEKGASIGANATIICGVTIGAFSMIGSGSVVTKNVPAYALMVGNPAKQIGWVCKCGFKLDETGICSECGAKLNTTDIILPAQN